MLGGLAFACLAVPAVAFGAFGDGSPTQPRVGTPNDPKFDRCEADDPDPPANECTSYFEEDFRLFGFSPDSAYELPGVRTQYKDCNPVAHQPGQLDAQGRAANIASGDPPCSQIAGIRADSAWKYSTGDPDTVVAILDTGIEWDNEELVEKVHLNREELPVPKQADGSDCAAYDCKPGGVPGFNVTDYADDPRVADDAGDTESDSILDASDLIATFSNNQDNDSNGYVDDIAGWDFFDDDNDPFDASSCCNAEGHGSDRAQEAVAETNNQNGSPGICPDCQLLPLRVWDTFVVPTDNFAMGVIYATDNDADVVEGAVGGLTNTRFARSSFTYADRNGVALTLVSSDINSANHNYPTNYNEAIYVGGSLPDTAPNDSCTGPGGIPFIGGSLPDADPPPQFVAGCNAFLQRLSNPGLPRPIPINPTATLQPPTTSFFRNANLTQYGGKADIVLVGSTGSANTGQAAGAAALLESFAESELGSPLSGNETRQLLTMSAEDVRPLNTGTIGPADKANVGWDDHFGYGRVNLAGAMARITNDKGTAPDLPCADARPDCIPPEAQIDSPDWFAPVNVDRLPAAGLPVHGRAAAPHGSVGAWELEYACGQDALDADFEPVPDAGGGPGATIEGTGARAGLLGTIPVPLLEDLAANCDGSVLADPGRPAGTLAEPWPANPYPSPDPERHAVQLRLTVHDAQDAGNFGRYRKTIFPYSDDGNHAAWPRPVGSGSNAGRLTTASGGEASPRLYDLDGDNELDVLQATSSGELQATHADGTPVAGFGGGQPVTTDRYAFELNHPVPAGVVTPRESLRVPAIGDVDGDREAEIVDTAGEHVYVWSLDGERELKIRLDPALSEPCKPGKPEPCFNAADRYLTPQNHLKRGFFGSPVLADLDGDDVLDIVATALDQHLYAFSGADGADLPGFPVKLDSDAAPGAEIITTPAIADLDGDDSNGPEIIVATNETIPGDPQFAFPPLFELFSFVLQSGTGSNPIYAVHGNGDEVDGWPVRIGIAAGDLLPLVLPGHDQAVLDADGGTPGGDEADEVSISAATSLVAPGGVGLVDGDGTRISTYSNPDPNPRLHDQGPILNLADYQSIGDINGSGLPSVVKGGLTPNGAVNLLAVNQNLPFNHVEQAWEPRTGAPIPGFPRATDDFQLLSQGSVARVAGDGPSRQILMGTGMYNLHAYDGVTGLDASGWPKFTGGWIQSTPAVGDADGDGSLDVSALTREGWSFLWSTDVDACDDSNEEWWTYHHDERSTANYGTDGRPPGTPRALAAKRNADGSVTLGWTAPGDDWLCGEAAEYQVLVASTPIGSPKDGSVVVEQPPAGAVDTAETASLTAAQVAGRTHAAVIYRDEAGNWGLLKSTRLPAQGAGGGGIGGGGTGGGYYEECANAINGSPDNDNLKGTAGADRLRGRGGDDRLKGRGGEDCVSGQSGQDRLSGGAGGDLLKGGRGKDRLSGGAGDDVIRARRGARDRINCGAGDDVAFVNRNRDRVARNCEKVRQG